MECGKNYCVSCGPRKQKQIMAKVIRGMLICFGMDVRTTLWTFTFRGRRPRETGEQFRARTTAPDISALRPEEQLPVTHRYFRKFLKRYERRWKERLEYFRTWELTKAGLVHYHAVVRIPPGINRGTLNKWARETWAEVTEEPGNADRISWGLHTGNKAGRGIASAAQYAAKYAIKDYSANPLGEQLQKGVRRISKSNGLVWLAAGDLDKFVTAEGEIHDERGYRQAYGRAYYRAITNDLPEKWAALEELVRRKAIKERTLMVTTTEYDENRTWTDPPNMFIIVVQDYRNLALTNARRY